MDEKTPCNFCESVGIKILENNLEEFNYKNLNTKGDIPRKKNSRGPKRKEKVFCLSFVKRYDTVEVQSNTEVYSSFATIYINPVI